MKSNHFRTARKRSFLSVQRIGASVIMMGLAMTAAARDGSTSLKEQVPAVKDQSPNPGTKTAHKPRRWLQVGIASWYGSHFQGHKTATGEPFDMNLMTCAHPTLPLGTWLRVTNLRNRKTAFVRVNDRGPLFDGRIIDLSFAAAQSLEMSGIGKVKLETVRATDPELAQALVAQLQVPVLLDTTTP